MALVDVEGVFYATVLVGGTRQATAATKWALIPACSGITPVPKPSSLAYHHTMCYRLSHPPNCPGCSAIQVRSPKLRLGKFKV
jgi:hypothetical protein